ncbi:hypothetical protein GW17_00033085, partial [Ensete ventricosum]
LLGNTLQRGRRERQWKAYRRASRGLPSTVVASDVDESDRQRRVDALVSCCVGVRLSHSRESPDLSKKRWLQQ